MSRSSERGFTLIEALIALAILSTAVVSFLGMRTNALMDSVDARSWRLAREIAEQALSELRAGAHEIKPESGIETVVEKYPDFRYTILIGETDISDWEAMRASEADMSSDSRASEKLQWRRDRNDVRLARQKGMSLDDYRENQNDELDDEEDRVPSEDEFDDVLVVVTFPDVRMVKKDERTGRLEFKIKAKISTMAIAGLTPEEAEAMADSEGDAESSSNAGSESSGGSSSGQSENSGGDK